MVHRHQRLVRHHPQPSPLHRQVLRHHLLSNARGCLCCLACAPPPPDVPRVHHHHLMFDVSTTTTCCMPPHRSPLVPLLCSSPLLLFLIPSLIICDFDQSCLSLWGVCVDFVEDKDEFWRFWVSRLGFLWLGFGAQILWD
ncbi:hypothetical protein Sjap_015032 [Stephania japonica]|uniref:Uncharacterized protein n=1 Tax=Stephania japonica TaxID=461633 RepID=A0AAP0IJ57_9MAGN